jgi:nitroreductase
MTLSAVEAHKLKQAHPIDGVLPVLHQRWSPRSFTDRDVSKADLHKVFEAARWAASSSNRQPWSYLVGVRNSTTHEKIAQSLVSFNQAWAPKAPVLILGVTKAIVDGKPNEYALYDLGAATALLTLEAVYLGLATHQMAGFDKDAARKALDIPEDYTLGSVTALGYQGEPAALENEKMVAQETSPRERKPLKDFVYAAWGEPADLG